MGSYDDKMKDPVWARAFGHLPKTRRMLEDPVEGAIRRRLVRALRERWPEARFVCDVGGEFKVRTKRDLFFAQVLKSLRHSKGQPDLLVFEARGGYCGLAMELKTKAGRSRRSPEQEEWIAYLKGQGWAAAFASGWPQPLVFLERYMELRPNNK